MELMIAVAVLTIGVISSMGAFKYINKAMTQSRIKTIATNLAQEKMEVLRNKSYFQLLVTVAATPSTGYSPNFTYDTESYPPQTITLWGMPAMTRVVKVDYITLSGSVATPLDYTDNDPGMKKITVTVMWTLDGTPRKVQLDSYYENPTAAVLSAGFSGKVTNANGGAVVGDALVQVMGSPKWRGYSDPATGKYSFQVAPGTYTLVCSTQGYFPETSSTLFVAAGPYTTKNFTLSKIAVGTISGMAYIRDHLLISQVVGSSENSSGFFQEWVEVYNPTTWTWTMANGLNAGVVGLAYQKRSQDIQVINLDYLTLTLPSQHYYLFANTGTVRAANFNRQADAVYNTAAAGYPNIIQTHEDPGNDAAGVGIGWLATLTGIDAVGWKTGGLSPDLKTGTPLNEDAGLELNELYIRKTSPSSMAVGVGRAYNTNNNIDDFMVMAVNYAPKNSAAHEDAATGTPAAGAVVDANDGLSSSALVSSTGYFLLTNVATCAVPNSIGTWEVMVSSYTVLNSSAGLAIASGQNNNVGTVVLSTAISGGIASGYVYGSGPEQNRRLASIRVGSGGVTANTNSQGYYRLFLGTGTVSITANYGLENGGYQSADAELVLEEGVITGVPYFHLAQGGYLTGYVTTGVGALPNIVVQATDGGPVYEDTSDSTGHYYIYATTSAVAYTVTPVLDPLMSYTSLPTSPLTVAMAVAGSSVFSGTITVVGALGTIVGTVVKSSVAITTGVLVVASTAAVSDSLPTVTAASSPSQATVYSISSQADGTYSLDVRSSTTTPYYMKAFYPVVDANSGAVSCSTRSYSAVWVSTAGATTARDFVW